jgi:hypothetical protein
MPKYQFDESKPIKVYFNLHKRQFSIMQGGLVVQHLFYLDMQDVTFHVQPAGNAKVRREKKKNVHAYVKGMLAPDYRYRNLTRIGYITYNPYKYQTFVWENNKEPIHSAEWVSLDCNCRLLAEDRKPYMKVRKKNY